MRQGARRGSMVIELFIDFPHPLEVADHYFKEAYDVIALISGCIVKHLAHRMLHA
jgi:hypothetical protein